MLKKIITVLFFFFPSCIFAQDTLLTLQQAIEAALKNNFDIQLSKNLNEQQETQNTIGNAGMLPDIGVSGSYRHSTNTLKQNYSSGQEVNSDNVVSENELIDVSGTWMIFDGLRMFNIKKKLSELSMLSNDQLKIQIENTLQSVMNSYYFLVRQEQLMKSLREEIILSEERVKISDRKFKNGSGSKLEWLQAKAENNRQKSAELQLQTTSSIEKINLNHLMGRDVETDYNIEDTLIFTYNPSLEDLKKTVDNQNTELSYYRRNQRIAELSLSETKGLRWPEISLNGDYIYSKSTNEKGFTLLNQSKGFVYGVTATLPLFQGLNINRQVKTAKLNVIYSDLTLKSTRAQISEELLNAWIVFRNNVQALALEEENITYAREVLMISNERYRVGVSNAIEQQEAQQTFEDAMRRLADARFNTKVSETKLRLLNGELVK